MTFLRSILLALSLALFGIQPVVASVISDGSSGEFRPTADFTLDLSGLTVPQYSSTFIDAGIKLTFLTPTGGDLILKRPPVIGRPGADLIGGDISLSPGVDLTLRDGPSIIRGGDSTAGGELILGSGAFLRQTPTPVIFQAPDPIPIGIISAVPEPSTILLLLPGLILLVRGAWRKAAP